MASPLDPKLEAVSKKFQEAVDKAVNQVATASLPTQKSAFECCVKCFDGPDVSIDSIGACVQRCQTPMEDFSRSLQHEMNSLQEAMQSCQKLCYTRYEGAYTDAKNETDKSVVQRSMENCVGDCFTSRLPQVDEIRERLLRKLNETSSETSSSSSSKRFGFFG